MVDFCLILIFRVLKLVLLSVIMLLAEEGCPGASNYGWQIGSRVVCIPNCISHDSVPLFGGFSIRCLSAKNIFAKKQYVAFLQKIRCLPAKTAFRYVAFLQIIPIIYIYQRIYL